MIVVCANFEYLHLSSYFGDVVMYGDRPIFNNKLRPIANFLSSMSVKGLLKSMNIW